MQDQLDPVDRALESVRARQWPGDYEDNLLKDKLMREFRNQRTPSRLSRRGALIAALTVMLLGGAGFAAAGGVEIVKGWFITVTVDGEPVEVTDADITIETQGDSVTVTVENLEVAGEPLHDMTIDTVGEPATVTIGCIEASEHENGSTVEDPDTDDDLAETDAGPEEGTTYEGRVITIHLSGEVSEDDD